MAIPAPLPNPFLQGGRFGRTHGRFQRNTHLDQNTKEPNWDPSTGDIYIPLDFRNYAELGQNLCHELFHAVQNSYFTILGLDSRRWWIEATADYASCKVAEQGGSASMSRISQKYFSQPLTTVNESHEYETANFVDYLVGPELAPEFRFHEMFQAVAKGDSSVFPTLNDYIMGVTGETLAEKYRGFAAYVLFNSSGPLEQLGTNLMESNMVEGPPLLQASDDEMSHAFKLRDNYTAGVWGFTVEPNDTKATTRSINIEGTGNIPADLYVDVYVLKNDLRRGGVVSSGTIAAGIKKAVSLSVGRDDAVYIVVANGGNSNQSIVVKVSDALTATPTPTPAAVGEIKIAAQGSIQSRDASRLFGTVDNPIPVHISGAIAGGQGLQFEGTEFYSRYGGEKDVLAFVYSIPATADSDSISFKKVVVAFGDPDQTVITRHLAATQQGENSIDTSYSWAGWSAGSGFVSNPGDAFSLGLYWANGTPVSETDCVFADASRVGEGNRDSGAAFFELDFSYRINTQYFLPDGSRSGTGQDEKADTSVVAIRLVER